MNTDLIKKINQYINRSSKRIQDPINIHKSYLLIETNDKILTIDRFDISIDNIIDMCDFPYIDKLG